MLKSINYTDELGGWLNGLNGFDGFKRIFLRAYYRKVVRETGTFF